MTQKLFKYVFLVALAVFLGCTVLLTSVLYGYFSQKKTEDLHTEATWIAAAIEENGYAFLDKIENGTNLRATVVAPDGTVLYDTLKDPAQMPNHLAREEITEALQTGHGVSNRYSETTFGRTINCALRLQNGTVLRMSATQYTVSQMIISMFTQIILIIVLALVLSFFIASHVAKAIVRPINEINLKAPDERDVYDELRPFVKRINLQNRQLQAQMTQLQAAHEKQDQMRREFTANVSHELKTPLTSISGFAEILRAGLVKAEDVPRFAGNIYNEAQRMITLVNDILRLSRLDENTVAETPVAVDLQALCTEQIRRLQPFAEQQGVTFRQEGETVTVYGIPHVLEEIVYNLCDNAVKYNRPNGTVTVRTAKEGTSVLLSVSDTGIGIPEKDQPRVFERFYRVDKSHSREMGGTGLGLSIVKHAAQLHHAVICLNSKEGIGTQITLRFPQENLFHEK